MASCGSFQILQISTSRKHSNFASLKLQSSKKQPPLPYKNTARSRVQPNHVQSSVADSRQTDGRRDTACSNSSGLVRRVVAVHHLWFKRKYSGLHSERRARMHLHPLSGDERLRRKCVCANVGLFEIHTRSVFLCVEFVRGRFSCQIKRSFWFF